MSKSGHPDRAHPDAGIQRLTIEGLSVTLPNGRRLFNDVSLSVGPGKLTAVLGVSGAGKSTLGDVLFNLLSDRAKGSVVTARKMEADESRMALILQRGSLFDHLSVVGNIQFAARRTRNKRLSIEDVNALLDEVGIKEAASNVAGLSGGEERRVTVARGLAAEPDFFFFDEPGAGLDIVNVRRLGALIRRVCSEHKAGAVLVTHNPLLAALTADQVLFLDRFNGSLEPLLKEWPGPTSVSDTDGMEHRRTLIEDALVAQAERTNERMSTGLAKVLTTSTGGRLARRLAPVGRVITAPGRLLYDFLAIIARLPWSLAHPRDFAKLFWHSLRLTGYSGFPFYALVAAIFSATFLSIAFAAAQLVSPQTIMENLRGDFILALTPPLCGFLFSARSGSALAAWLGGLSLRRQTDALRSLGVSVHDYLKIPAFLGTFVGFGLTVLVFGAAMYGAAVLTAYGFDVENANRLLLDSSEMFQRQLYQKTLLYGALVGVIGTHVGLLSKRSSSDVATGITRSIILCTLGIVLSELFFAIDLH